MALTIPSIFTAIDKFTAPVEKMQRSMGAFGAAGDTAAARLDRRFSRLASSAGNVAVKAGAIGLAVAAPLVLAVNKATDFEKQMSNVSTLVDTNVESMTAMGDSVLGIAKKIPKPIEELTASLYDIRSAGISAADSMGTLEMSSKLAVAGLSTTSEATDVMTSAMNAFKSENLTSTQIADIFFKTVKAGKTTVSALASAFGSTAPILQSAGVKFADFQAATAALTTVGTPATQAQTQLRAAIVALQKPTVEMSKVFKKLGVGSGEELIKKMGGLGGAFEAVNQKTTEMRLNNGKTWGSVEALASVTSLTGATNLAYVDTLKSMTSGTEELEKAFQKQSATQAAEMQKAKNNIDILSIRIGDALYPALDSVLTKITPVIESIAEFVKNNPGVVEMAAGFAAIAFAISGIAGLISGVSTIIAGVASLAPLFGWLSGILANWIAPILQVVWAVFIGLIETAAAFLGIGVGAFVAIGVAIAVVIGIFISLYNHWDMITAAFKNGGIIEGLKAIGAVILDVLLYPLQKVMELASNLPAFLGGGLAGDAANSIQGFRAGMGLAEAPVVASSKVAQEDAAVSRSENNTNKNVVIDFKNLPKGTVVDGVANSVMPNMGSTMSF